MTARANRRPPSLLRLVPQYRDYVWGGQRLRPGQVTAEAWVIYEENRVADGPLAGRTLAEIAAEDPAQLLGPRAVERTGARFPLLIKILDCAQWLSLQVHPDDAWAARLEGPGHFGKTEAWHVLDAEPGAQIIAGVRPDTPPDALAEAIRAGMILDWVQFREVQPGDTVFMPARTIHALGPGLLVYEVQQTSDLTYRVFDWNRPPSPGRELHVDKSLAVADPTATAAVCRAPALGDGQRATLVACPYFTLELIAANSRPVALNTARQSFHALTVIEGAAAVQVPGLQAETHSRRMSLGRFDSVVIPASTGAYELQGRGRCRILKASLEESPRAAARTDLPETETMAGKPTC